jgi:polar amino acid transport system substrate-binding protein
MPPGRKPWALARGVVHCLKKLIHKKEVRKMCKKQIAVYVLLLATIFFLLVAATNVIAQEKKSRLYEVLERGQVIVAVISEIEPVGFINAKGELDGFDIDIAKLLAKTLFQDEKKIKFEKISFDARWAAVQTGKVDVGIMSTTIWPDRLAKVNFTGPYMDAGIGVIVRKDSKINKIEDINNEKYTVTHLAIPSEVKAVKEYFPKAKPLVLNSEADMLAALRAGRAQAMTEDIMVARYHAVKFPEIKVMDRLLGVAGRNALFLRQDDFQWWIYLDTFVAELRSGTLYGEYSEIYKKWFGVMPPPQNFYMKR